VEKPLKQAGALLLLALLLSAGCGDDSAGRAAADPAGLLDPGVYDFYGTFSDNPEYADGTGKCAIPEPLACPSVTNFCIFRLGVAEPDPRGVREIRGCSEVPGDPDYGAGCASNFWNVAVGKVYMLPFILSDWDGGGQVRGSLDPYGDRTNPVSRTSMSVEEVPGWLPSWRIASWSTSLLPREATDAPSPGTVVLTIPYQNNLKPPPPPGAPPGTYNPPASTTGRAICRVTNPEAGDASKEASGTPLRNGRARLVTPHAILRTIVGGFVQMGGDVMSITTWDGAFCRRGDPEQSCVPEDFPCPDLDD